MNVSKQHHNVAESPDIDQQQPSPIVPIRLAAALPWFGILLALLTLGFLLILSTPQLVRYYQIPSPLHSVPSLVALVLFVALIIWLDLRRVTRTLMAYQQQIEALRAQLTWVWQSRRKQQQRANLYSGHTDRLKTFISDKLLESIEYDEKFLHFKGIAAEVRHNGVISFDKVNTALHGVIQRQSSAVTSEENAQAVLSLNLETVAECQTAIDAMRYLWDLLDLSTAENIALHIGNQLIESEEHYCQLQLDAGKTFAITQSIAVPPIFNPQLAALTTFAIFFDDATVKRSITHIISTGAVADEPFYFENNEFRIELIPTPALLGNPNHLILMLENLIKNAQFFCQKNRYKQPSDRIALQLRPADGYAWFSVYNRGPQIKTEDNSKIFNLGFSTRRSKQHHGKGLGLYFAREIIRGYSGTIQAHNIENQATHYAVRLNLDNGDSILQAVACEWIERRMRAMTQGSEQWQTEIVLSSKRPITSIEIIAKDQSDDCHFEVSASEREFEWVEPNPQPRWIIKFKRHQRQHQVLFKPLDISGVRFDIKLPTADSRLNEQEPVFD